MPGLEFHSNPTGCRGCNCEMGKTIPTCSLTLLKGVGGCTSMGCQIRAKTTNSILWITRPIALYCEMFIKSIPSKYLMLLCKLQARTGTLEDHYTSLGELWRSLLTGILQNAWIFRHYCFFIHLHVSYMMCNNDTEKCCSTAWITSDALHCNTVKLRLQCRKYRLRYAQHPSWYPAYSNSDMHSI